MQNSGRKYMSCSNKKSAYFPLFVSLEGKKALVAGGGIIGTRRAGVLADFGAEVTVVAPDISDEIRRLGEAGRLEIRKRNFQAEDLEGICIAVAATGDVELNSRIADESRRLGILYNNASNKDECNFFFPAVVRHEDMIIGINGSGNNHRGVKEMREKIQALVCGEDDNSCRISKFGDR